MRTPNSSTPIGLDTFPVSADEAVELFVHHIKLAGVFFANTPDDLGEQLKQELRRGFADDRWIGFGEEYCAASEQFVDALVKIYEDDKRKDLE